jgi:predicted Fe-S protein YdhL (DUF1289 family)
MPEALPASPCVRLCCLDEANETCVGCFRTLAEITGWQAADGAERERILKRCAERREAYQLKYPALRR